MKLTLKKLINSTIFNLCIFILLIIGIQNSGNKSRANLLINETIDLPISFIIGSSFIAGSITGSLISILNSKKD
tara:strand:- start:482 stop:703 length:222 start_codon:yes stop_codon:yes gene_type:complete